ncbi:MAG TPA: hypothetical protein VFE53_16590, partial [Mucilaginibacter sp.]|nr:hypothetical protein [Mucilaginibacter sp.]
RKFVWGLGIVSAFVALGSLTGKSIFSKRKLALSKNANKKQTVTMLTQDGRLVTVDQSFLTANSRKVTNTELQNWIKK